MLSFDIDLGDLEASAKVDGHGQAKILTDEELSRLFEEGFQTFRDRALFAICMFTGCRISEALQLKAEMIKGSFITFTRETRKGKTGTQQVEIVPALKSLLGAWRQSGEIQGQATYSKVVEAVNKALCLGCRRMISSKRRVIVLG